MDIFNRNQTAELEKKFAGYTVLTAARSETGIFVCLMANDGSMAQYTMSAENETVAPEKIIRCNAQVHFTFGEETVCVNACDVTDGFIVRMNAAENARTKAEGDLAALRETVKNMEAAERTRRCGAARSAAEQELAKINANRAEDERFNEEIIRPVLEAADRGDYSECCDNGVWTGETMAINAVRSAAMEAQMAQDQANAEKQRNAAHKKYAWESGANANDAVDSLEAMYRAMTRE